MGGLIGVRVSSIVKWGYKDNFKPVYFFLRKNFKRTKTQIMPKPTNKIKLSEQKTTKATIRFAEKLLRGGKLFVLRFGPSFWRFTLKRFL